MDSTPGKNSASCAKPSRNGMWRFRRSYRWWLWALFLFAMVHRIVWLGSYPWPHATNDEYGYLWEGMSLWEGEAPLSWSMLPLPSQYILGHYAMDGGNYPVVQPAFDHPPLFQILAGLTGKIAGTPAVQVQLTNPDRVVRLWNPDLGRVRLLSVALAGVGFWLLWNLSRLVMGRVAALICVALYSSLSLIVLHQRLLVCDVLLVPLVLGVLLALERWKRGTLSTRATAAWVISGVALAAFTKIIGLCLAVAVVAWASAALTGKMAFRVTAWATAGVAIGVGLMLGFAGIYGFDAFLAFTREQSSRFIDLNGLFDLIREQRILTERHFDEWMMGGWVLALAGGLSATPAAGPLFAALIGYGVAYSFFAPVESYGWYMLPIYPFLCAGWASGIRTAWRNPKGPMAMLVFALLLGAAAGPWLDYFPTARTAGRYLYVILAAGVLLPWGSRFDVQRKHVMRTTMACLLTIGLIGEVQRQIAIEAAQAQAFVPGQGDIK